MLVKDSYLLVEKMPFVVELLQWEADGCLNPRIPTRKCEQMSVSRNRKRNISVSPYTGNRAIYEILQKSVCFQKPIKLFVSLYLFLFFPATLKVHTCNIDGALIKQPNFYECRNSPSNTPGNLVRLSSSK